MLLRSTHQMTLGTKIIWVANLKRCVTKKSIQFLSFTYKKITLKSFPYTSLKLNREIQTSLMEKTHVKTSIEHRKFIYTICKIRCVVFPTWEREISLYSRIYDATPALLHFESKNGTNGWYFVFCIRTQI